MTTDAERAAYAAKHYASKEADIEGKANTYAKEHGCWHVKFKSSNNRGVPDRIYITPDGAVFFIEFKKPSKRPAKAGRQQKLVIDEMRDNKAVVFVTNDLGEAKAIIYNMVKFGSP